MTDDIQLDPIEEKDDFDAVEEDEPETIEDSDGEDNGPEDLAAAFRRVQQMDKADSTETLEASGSGDAGESGEDDGDNDGGEGEPEADDAADDGGDTVDRGSTDDVNPAVYQNAQQALIKDLNRAAVNQAAKEFKDQGIREFTMGDIYQRGNDGRVTYRNPDDPNRPFANRMEAQQWIDSFNKQLQNELRRRAVEIRDENAKKILPSIRLLQFAPTYDSMDPDVREVLDDLIEDYEVTNAKGEVVGYSCDLNKMFTKATKLAAKYAAPKQKKAPAAQKKSGPRRQPATDMPTRGTAAGKKSGNQEPETLEQAFAMLRQQEGR